MYLQLLCFYIELHYEDTWTFCASLGAPLHILMGTCPPIWEPLTSMIDTNVSSILQLMPFQSGLLPDINSLIKKHLIAYKKHSLL